MLWWLRLNTSAVNSRLYYMFGFKINCKQILFHTALWAAQHHITTWGHLCLRHLLLGNKKTSVLIGWANMKFWKKKKYLEFWTYRLKILSYGWHFFTVVEMYLCYEWHCWDMLDWSLICCWHFCTLRIAVTRTQTTKYPFNQWNRFDFDLCEEKSKQFPHPI